MLKHSVILDMSCDKLAFWSGHCQHLKIKNLLVSLVKTELHATKPQVIEPHTSILNSKQPTESINPKYTVPAKQVEVNIS